MLVFIDWKRKTCGLGPVFAPSTDLEADMNEIRESYAPILGKYLDNQRRIDVATSGGAVQSTDQPNR